MTLQDFWKNLQTGGTTDQGLAYHIIDDGKLHIISPFAKNDKYYIKKNRVAIYFRKLQNGMDHHEFSYRHSAWFRRVYEHILNKNV